MTKEEMMDFDFQLTKLDIIANHMDIVMDVIPEEERRIRNDVYGMKKELNAIVDVLNKILINNR